MFRKNSQTSKSNITCSFQWAHFCHFLKTELKLANQVREIAGTFPKNFGDAALDTVIKNVTVNKFLKFTAVWNISRQI